MSFQETRPVILPNGLRVMEIRTLDDGEVTYHYEICGLRLNEYFHRCSEEYNGQILDAREPDHEQR